jgi:hypothetical protein
VKEVDDTPLPKSESEDIIEVIVSAIEHLSKEVKEAFANRDDVIRALQRQVANLEARKPPQDTNPDPEWYA